MNNPIYHARLLKWFKRNADLQCSHIVGLPEGAGDIAIPTTAFNVVYQLTHLYHHFFDEGIGMLRSKDGRPSKVSPDCAGWDRRDAIGDIASDASVSSAFTTDFSASTALDVVQRELKYLELWKFAGAVMFVLHEVLGLAEDKMIVPVDEKRGRLLLAEILDGGNFGSHFTKYAGFTHQSMGKKYFLKIWRNMHFVRYYPAEALCEPLFRTWHFFWRLKYKK